MARKYVMTEPKASRVERMLRNGILSIDDIAVSCSCSQKYVKEIGNQMSRDRNIG